MAIFQFIFLKNWLFCIYFISTDIYIYIFVQLQVVPFFKVMRPIFCGNFEYDARQSDLERLFRRYGKVDRVDMKSGKSSLCSYYFHGFRVKVSYGRKPSSLTEETGITSGVYCVIKPALLVNNKISFFLKISLISFKHYFLFYLITNAEVIYVFTDVSTSPAFEVGRMFRSFFFF